MNMKNSSYNKNHRNRQPTKKALADH